MNMTATKRQRAAVIGSGFGGLALAIRLQSAGIATTLFEARERPGGRAYVYEDAGFTFDAGPTVITDPTCLEALFALSGRQLRDYVTLVPIQPFYRLLWPDGSSFDYTNDDDRLMAQIEAMSPADVEGYRRFLDYAERVFEKGYIELGHVPFLDFKSMIKVAPDLIGLQAFRSVYAMVSHFIKDERLRQAMSFHSLLVGGNPFASSAIYTLIHSLERRWGVHFPIGGTGALVQGLVRLFEDLGGKVRLATPVERILVEDDNVCGVATAAGGEERFDLVASNGDVVTTYDRLLGHHARGREVANKLKRRRFSPSLFVAYFGLEGRADDLAHHTIVFGPRYKGLLKEIYGGTQLADDFSLYLHAPSVTDPSLAPDGCMAFYVLSPVPHLGHAAINWEEEGPRYRDRIFDHLERHCLPGLKQRLVTSRIFTPADFRSELGAHLGSAFSLEPVLTQSAWFRPHNRDDRLKGLYLVGAGTHPGAGIPGVVGSARATASLMLADAGITLDAEVA
ncbi:MAG: phytoene desaturase [Pseudomonadota bacterium]